MDRTEPNLCNLFHNKFVTFSNFESLFVNFTLEHNHFIEWLCSFNFWISLHLLNWVQSMDVLFKNQKVEQSNHVIKLTLYANKLLRLKWIRMWFYENKIQWLCLIIEPKLLTLSTKRFHTWPVDHFPI